MTNRDTARRTTLPRSRRKTMTYRLQTRNWFECCAGLGLIACLAATPARSQGSSGTLAPIGSGTVLPRNTSFHKSPGAVRGLYAFAPDTFDIQVQGPSGLQLSIRNLESMNLPGGKNTLELFELVDPSAPIPAPATSVVTTSSANPQPVGGPVRPDLPGVNQDPTMETIVALNRKLIYKGIARSAVSHPDTFFRAVKLELQATRTGTSAVINKTTFALTDDDGPPTITACSSTPAVGVNNSDQDFPPVVHDPILDTKTYTMNFLKLHSNVVIVAQNFSIRREWSDVMPAQMREFYKVVVIYDDGAKFAYVFQGTGAANTFGSMRIEMQVPNIGRGGFKVELRSPFGRTTSATHHSFSSDLFIDSRPIAFGNISLLNVDTPMSTVDEESLWPGAHFQEPQLPTSRTCDDVYCEWESVTLGGVSAMPAAVATARITRTPAPGSLAHSGNMPRFSCTSAGLGSVEAHWTAKLRVHIGECAERRVLD
jgi:hypothetical protein